MSRSERLVQRIVQRIPTPVIAAPEQMLLNAAVALIGFNALLAQPPGSVLYRWPHWAVLEWAAGMIIGGLCALTGVWTDRRPVARFGFLCVGVCCTILALALLVEYGWRGLPAMLVYLGIAAAKAIRLMAGSAHRAEVIRAGRVMGDR